MATKKTTKLVPQAVEASLQENPTTRRTAQDAQAETERFYILLSPRVHIQYGSISIELPTTPGKTGLYPLSPKQSKNDQVQDWAMGEYGKLYPDEREPLIRNYKAARSQVERTTDIPDDAQIEPQAEQPQESAQDRPASQRSKRNAAIVQAVQKLKDFSVPAREVGVHYARVPYTEMSAGFTGIWRLDPVKPSRLLDCAIYFTDINRPHAESKSLEYSGTLVAINAQGEEKKIPFSRDALEDKGLDAKLLGFADWPTLPTDKYRLQEALKHLMREKNVKIHDEYPSLGFASHSELGLVWIANNGIETAQGFLSSKEAPFTAPVLFSPGNGYRALADLPAFAELKEDLWSLLLDKLNSDNWARMYGKLGAVMRVLFPEETVQQAGKLDFVIETVGDGSGQGKSAEDNFVLSLFGADFTWNRPPLLTTDDTSPSRPRTMEAMRYLPFMTEDRKARENNPQFAKQHETRKKLIEQYADNTGGGSKMGNYGRNVVSRGNPQGVPFMTGNVDHGAYGLRSDAGEEEATEWRVCTFLLTPDEKADYKTSTLIDARRRELTAWGTYERRWIMQQYNADRSAFMLRVQGWRAQAEERVQAICAEWPHTRPMNVCIDIVWGMIARQAFIEDMLPQTYTTHFLWNWIELVTIPFIENRLARAQFLQAIIASRQSGLNLGDFVLDTLRYALGTSQYCIASQQEKLLQPEDVPLSLTKFGMKLDQTLEGNEIYRPGQHGILGYYLARKDAIAFNFSILYPLLEVAAQKPKYPLPTKKDFKRAFAETGLPFVKRDEYGEIVRPYTTEKINGKPDQYITLPLRALYPVGVAQEGDDEEEELLQEVETNIVPFKRAEPERVTPERSASKERPPSPSLAGNAWAEQRAATVAQGSRGVMVADPPRVQENNDPFSVLDEDIPEI